MFSMISEDLYKVDIKNRLTPIRIVPGALRSGKQTFVEPNSDMQNWCQNACFSKTSTLKDISSNFEVPTTIRIVPGALGDVLES